MRESHAVITAAPTTVPQAFRRIVERFAERPALETGNGVLTYAELDRLSNRLAHRLLKRSGRRPVAMVAPLAPSSIVVLLGALKAGRVFVPLGPRDPPERVRLVTEQIGAPSSRRTASSVRLAIVGGDACPESSSPSPPDAPPGGDHEPLAESGSLW